MRLPPSSVSISPCCYWQADEEAGTPELSHPRGSAHTTLDPAIVTRERHYSLRTYNVPTCWWGRSF